MFIDVRQNTEDWFKLRLGNVTSSNLGLIMANEGKAFGNPAKEYALKIALERKKGEALEADNYSNAWMERGHELEPVARNLYEEKLFVVVKNGGFFKHETLSFGGSPDGCVAHENGGIEIKCPKHTTHFNNLKRGAFDPAYRWQLLGNLWLCEFDYIDFISYSPEFPRKTQIFIDRLRKEDFKEEIDKIQPRLIEFESLIKQIEQKI